MKNGLGVKAAASTVGISAASLRDRLRGYPSRNRQQQPATPDTMLVQRAESLRDFCLDMAAEIDRLVPQLAVLDVFEKTLHQTQTLSAQVARLNQELNEKTATLAQKAMVVHSER